MYGDSTGHVKIAQFQAMPYVIMCVHIYMCEYICMSVCVYDVHAARESDYDTLICTKYLILIPEY